MTRVVRMFLALVAANAVLGSVVLLAGGLDGSGGRVFATSLLTTAAVLVGIACMTGWQQVRLRVAAIVGIASTCAGFALADAAVWWTISGEWQPKLMGTLIIVGVAAAATCLLGLAELAPRHRWTFAAAAGLIVALVAMALAAIWTSLEGDWFLRVMGVGSVVLAALVLVIPVLHRVAALEARRRGGETGGVAFCPRCGHALQAEADVEVGCAACGSAFTVGFSDRCARSRGSGPSSGRARRRQLSFTPCNASGLLRRHASANPSSSPLHL